MIGLMKPRAVAATVVGASMALAGAVAPADSAIEGYVLTQRITSANEPTMTLKVKVAQGRVRVEMQGGPQGAMPEGVFMLLRDDGKVSVVMPSEGMALQMDAQQLSGGMQSMMSMMGMSAPTYSDVSIDVQELGAGETMLGYATRKYRVRQRYTVSGGMRGSQPVQHDDVTEMWMTTSIPGMDDGLQRFADVFGSAFGGGGSGGSTELAAAMKGKIPPGYPLKTVVTSTETRNGSAGQPQTTTLEVLDVTRTNIEASEFELPAGIQLLDPAMMMRGRGGR